MVLTNHEGVTYENLSPTSSRLQLLRYICSAFIINLVLILSTGAATAVSSDQKADNNQYDARIAFNQGLLQNLTQPQQSVISRMTQKSRLAFTFDNVSVLLALCPVIRLSHRAENWPRSFTCSNEFFNH